MTKILILAAIVRLAFVNQHDFWFDERASLFVSGQPLSNLLTAAAQDTHTPLYFLLLKAWSTLSSDLLYLRFLSVVFGALSVAIAYKIFLKLTNERVAKLASLLFTLSPLLIYYSTEVRMYSLFVLTTLSYIWFTLKYIDKKDTKTLLFVFLTGSAALYTHYYALLIIIAVNIVYFARSKPKSKLKSWLTTQSAIILSFIPWLSLSLQYSKPDCWCFSPLTGIPSTIASFTVGGMGIVTLKDYLFNAPSFVLWLFVVSVIFMTLLFIIGSWKTWINKNLSLLTLFFVPLISATLIGFVLPVFSPRALIIISPFFYLLISVGIYSFKPKSSKVLAAVALTLFATILAIQFANPFFHKLPVNKSYLYAGYDSKQ